MLRDIRAKVENNEISNFSLKGRHKILFKTVEFKPFTVEVLAIDDQLLSFLTKQLHIRGYHWSADLLIQYLQRHFWSNKFKKVIRDVTNSCISCTFSMPQRKSNFVMNEAEDETGLVWSTISLDLIENLRRSSAGYNFVLLVVDRTTNFTIPLALYTKQSREVAKRLEDLFNITMAPQIVESDYATCFTGNSFRLMLRRYGVLHRKTCPTRSVANITEAVIRRWRDFAFRFLTSLGVKALRDWHKHIGLLSSIFNSQILHGSRGVTSSPAELYWGPHRYLNNRLVAISANSELEAARREVDLEKVRQIRNKRRESYRGAQRMEDRFKIGHIVVRPRGKLDHPKISGNKGTGTGFGPRGAFATMYEIIGLTRTSARCLDLQERITRTMPLSELRHINLDSTEAFGLLMGPNLKDNFASNLFRSRSGFPALYEVLLADRKKRAKDGQQSDQDAAEEENERFRRQVREHYGLDPDDDNPGEVRTDDLAEIHPDFRQRDDEEPMEEDDPEPRDLQDDSIEEDPTEDDGSAEPVVEPRPVEFENEPDRNERPQPEVAASRPGTQRYSLRTRGERRGKVFFTSTTTSGLKSALRKTRGSGIKKRKTRFSLQVRCCRFDKTVHGVGPLEYQVPLNREVNYRTEEEMQAVRLLAVTPLLGSPGKEEFLMFLKTKQKKSLYHSQERKL